jgi:hypothetical protein
MSCPLLPLFDYRAKQNSNCIINMRCVYIFGFLSRMPFWRRSDWYMHFNYPQRIFHFPFLSFSLITLNVSWILRPVSSSVSRQNGIHSRWPIGQLRNQKMKFSKGKKEGGGGVGGILVHVFYDFPSSAAASASFISLPNLTISSTRIFPSVARKIQKIVNHTRS